MYWTMKTFAKRTKRTIFAVILILVAVACTQDDDIKDIFEEREWTLSYVQEGNVKRFSDSNKRYNVQFIDNSFNATTPGGATISGKWEADGDSRKFHCWGIQTTGSFKSDTIAQKMLQIFTDATEYDGDTHWLQIKQHKNVFMQFYSK